MTGTEETGYQTTLPKPRRPVKSGGDFVPVGVEGERLRRTEGDEALGAGRDDAGVDGVELEAGAGRERRGERDSGLVELAGVVGVRVERGHGEGDAAAGEADLFPVERRGDLQRDAGERGFAVVADGDAGADGDVLRRGLQANVEVERGEGDGEAVVVGGRWLGGGLNLRGGGAGLRGGVAVLVGAAGEDDLACRWLRRGCRLL